MVQAQQVVVSRWSASSALQVPNKQIRYNAVRSEQVHISLTYLFSEMIPLEFAEVLEAPQVIVVCRAALSAHGLPIQHLCDLLGDSFIFKLHPSFCEVLSTVLAHLLSPLSG